MTLPPSTGELTRFAQRQDGTRVALEVGQRWSFGERCYEIVSLESSFKRWPVLLLRVDGSPSYRVEDEEAFQGARLEASR